MPKQSVPDILKALCGALTDIGCVFDCETDYRGGNRSAYIFVRKPLPAKIRVADHKSARIDKDKGRAKMLVIDIDVNARGHGVAWQDAVAQIAAVRQ